MVNKLKIAIIMRYFMKIIKNLSVNCLLRMQG